MSDASDRRAVVQIGHQLDALLVSDGVVFVLAGRGLTDECRLTGDVAELREGGDENRLGSGRNGVVVQEGVGSRAGDAHIIHEQAEIHQAQLRRALVAQRIGQRAGPIGGGERHAPDCGHPEVHGELSQERRPGDLVQFTLEDFVRTVGIDPELDGEVAFGFGESGHVLHGVAFRRSGLAAFRGFLHGLSRLIEEAPNAFRNAGDRGYGIGDQIPGDIERDFSRLLRSLRELFCLRHRLQLSDRVDFRDATQ